MWGPFVVEARYRAPPMASFAPGLRHTGLAGGVPSPSRPRRSRSPAKVGGTVNGLGLLALAIYVSGFLWAFYVTVGWIARDEANQRERGNRGSPDALNGAVSIVGALFWPVLVVCWALGKLYRLTARTAK
jgi:hypothetical protein